MKHQLNPGDAGRHGRGRRNLCWWQDKSARTGRSGRGTKKEIVVGIKQRGGELRFFRAEDVKSGTLAKYIKENVSGDVDVIMTDEFSPIPALLTKCGSFTVKSTRRFRIRSGSTLKETLRPTVSNPRFSLLKRGIIGSWHKVSASVRRLPNLISGLAMAARACQCFVKMMRGISIRFAAQNAYPKPSERTGKKEA